MTAVAIPPVMPGKVGLLVFVGCAFVLAGCFAGGSSCSAVTGGVRCSFGGAGSGSASSSWGNLGTHARVEYQFGGAGSATITVKDNAGSTVFNRQFSGTGGQQGSDTTDAGVAGTWQIIIQAQNLAGGLQVSASTSP